MFKVFNKIIVINYFIIFTIFFKNKKNFIIIFFNKFFNLFYVNNLSIFLIITTSLTFLLCFFITDNKFFKKNKLTIVIFFSFLPTIILLTLTNNIINFFILYEFLLIPSYFLLKNSSPNRRINIIANYFLFWTQFGSFLVLIGVILIIKIHKIYYFNQLVFLININIISKLLIFFGFGVKIPIWPFHFWLSKTHVEANTGFSIFLSGILVKSAVYGFYKFNYLFFNNFKLFFFSIIIISILDSSLKIVNQIDLKKLIAFSTIQEMGFLLLFFSFYIHVNYVYIIYFVVFHTLISGYYFYFVDSLYKIYQSRINYNISGLSNINHKLSVINLLFLFLFIGIPFTIKFFLEFFILKMLFKINIFILYIIIVFAQYLSILFFFKNFISINYGSIKKLKINSISKKEYVFYLFIFVFLLIISFS